jgi:hypothetical protein
VDYLRSSLKAAQRTKCNIVSVLHVAIVLITQDKRMEEMRSSHSLLSLLSLESAFQPGNVVW